MSKQKVAITLRKAFEERQKRNGQYSLRSFARDLGVSPGRLSRILSGKDEAGHRLISAILKSKIFSSEEMDELAKCVKETESPFGKGSSYEGLSLDGQEAAAIWNHLAVFNLITLPGFKFNRETVSKRLGLSEEQVQRSVKFLLSHNYIRKTETGVFASNSDQLFFSPKHFKDIHSAHLDYLQANKKRAQECPEDSSFFGLVTVAMSDEAFQKAKTMMNKVLAKICREDATNPNQKVFHVSTQIFAVDDGPQ